MLRVGVLDRGAEIGQSGGPAGRERSQPLHDTSPVVAPRPHEGGLALLRGTTDLHLLAIVVVRSEGAPGGQGAVAALGRGGGADHRSEVHQRLVPGVRLPLREEGIRRAAERSGRRR